MKYQKITSNWIDRYNENELTEEERILFIKWMEENPILRTEVHIDACLNQLFQEEGVLDLLKKIQVAKSGNPEKFRAPGYLLLAASFLALVLFGGLYLLLRVTASEVQPMSLEGSGNPRDNIQKLISPSGISDSCKQGSINYYCFEDDPPGLKKGRYTEIVNQDFTDSIFLVAGIINYAPLVDYEILVGSVTRSSGLKLLTPVPFIEIQDGTPVFFKWIDSHRRHAVRIEIFNNLGNIVGKTPDIFRECYTVHTRGWPCGIYYWKLLLNEELITMGKISIR